MTLSETIQAATLADQAWSDALHISKINRWSAKAIGLPGSHLRDLYERKVMADSAMGGAFSQSRIMAEAI